MLIKETAFLTLTAIVITNSNPSAADSDCSLTQPAKDGDVSEVERLLREVAEVDRCSSLLFVREGAASYWIIDIDTTPLTAAAENGHYEIVRILLGAGANPDLYYVSDATPLSVAVENGYIEIVRILLEAGADPNNYNYNSGGYYKPPLAIAADSGKNELVKILLEAGADPNIDPLYSHAPLIGATAAGHSEIVRVLLEAGADSDIISQGAFRTTSTTPLIVAVLRGHNEIIKILLEAGAHPTRPGGIDVEPYLLEEFDPVYSSALHTAVYEGLEDAVEILLAAGANPNAKNDYGLTPLHIAVSRGALKFWTLLEYDESDGTQRAWEFLTDDVWFKNNVAVVNVLLAAGADTLVADDISDYGKTVWEYIYDLYLEPDYAAISESLWFWAKIPELYSEMPETIKVHPDALKVHGEKLLQVLNNY